MFHLLEACWGQWAGGMDYSVCVMAALWKAVEFVVWFLLPIQFSFFVENMEKHKVVNDSHPESYHPQVTIGRILTSILSAK